MSAVGIAVTAPGAAEVRVGIPPTGLTHASGSVKTQRGTVGLSWEHDRDSTRLEASIPVNVSAVVELPVLPDSSYYRIEGGAQAQPLEASGDLQRYRVGSGAWVFEAVSDTVAPEVTLVSPTNAGPLSQLAVQIDATDAGGLDRIVADIYQGANPVKSTSTVVGGAPTGTHAATVALSDGAYTVKYSAIDVAGNVSETKTFAFTIDATVPTPTIKDGATYTVKSGAGYDLISFKLYDAGKIDRVTINGKVKDLTNNTWSDVNYVEPGVFGGVKGENTLVVHDVAGNTKTVTFILN